MAVHTIPVPTFVRDRLRATHNLPHLVPNSTPVIAFGDFFKATIATIGLNPSRREFLSLGGVLLAGSARRLQTLASLGIPNMAAATPAHHQAIQNDCLHYFTGGTHYGWFKRFDPILQFLNSSYFHGAATNLACHLDLVQTATDPVWGKFPKATRALEHAHYLANESSFLLAQLNNQQIEKVLLNGQSVVQAFQGISGITLTPSKHTGAAGQPFTFYSGQYTTPSGRVIEVRGWNWNIQSSRVKGGVPVADIAVLC